MISVYLVRDEDGFEGRLIELHLFRRDVSSGAEYVVSTYEIDTSQLTSGYALSKQKSSTILLSPLDVEDQDVDEIIGLPDVLVTVGCAFVRDVIDGEESEVVPCVMENAAVENDQHAHVDQYRALTMLYHEADKDHDADDKLDEFLGEVDDLIRGGNSDMWSKRQSPKVEAMRRYSITDGDAEDVLAAIREEERVLKELNLGLQTLHSLSTFDKGQITSGNKHVTKVEFDSLRKFFSCVIKVNPKAQSMLSGVHTEVMNVAIYGEVVGASFTMEGGHVSKLAWLHTPVVSPNLVEDSDESDYDDEEEEEDSDSIDHGDEDEDDAFIHPVPNIRQQTVSVEDVSTALSPLLHLQQLTIGARCLTGDIKYLLTLGLQVLEVGYSNVSGELSESAFGHSKCLEVQYLVTVGLLADSFPQPVCFF
jgi:hypothetical protein